MHIMNPSVEMLESVILEQFSMTHGKYDLDQVKDFFSDFHEGIKTISQRLEEVDYRAAMERGSLLTAPFAVLKSGAVVRDLVMRPSFVFTSEDDHMEYAVVEGNQAFSEERFITDTLLSMHNVEARLQENIAT